MKKTPEIKQIIPPASYEKWAFTTFWISLEKLVSGLGLEAFSPRVYNSAKLSFHSSHTWMMELGNMF